MTSCPIRRRRTLLCLASAMAGIGVIQLPALAQSVWPNRPIKIVDVFAPGGSGDTIARAVGAKLATRLGQPVVVENRPGAGGNVGTESVVRATPDGYTLMLTSTANITAAASSKKPGFDFLKDLAPVGMIGATSLILVVAADSPIKTLQDLVELARTRPNEGVRYGSSGVGSMSHIGMELLAAEAKVQMLHVAYRGNSLAVTDLLSGQINAMLSTVATMAPLLQGGKVRGIVTTGLQRSPFMAGVPTSMESGYPGFMIDFWWGLAGPAGMPQDVIKRLNTELQLVLTDPEIRDLLGRSAAAPRPGAPEELARQGTQDLARWAKLIREANIRIE